MFKKPPAISHQLFDNVCSRVVKWRGGWGGQADGHDSSFFSMYHQNMKALSGPIWTRSSCENPIHTDITVKV